MTAACPVPVPQAMAAHDHKDSAAKEQLSRKVDNVYERVVYMDNNSITKVQASARAILSQASSAAKDLQREVDQSVGRAKADLAAGLAAELAGVRVQLNATRDLILVGVRLR